jgi:hypothetical protein
VRSGPRAAPDDEASFETIQAQGIKWERLCRYSCSNQLPIAIVAADQIKCVVDNSARYRLAA